MPSRDTTGCKPAYNFFGQTRTYIGEFIQAAWFSISEIPANICGVNIEYWQQFRQNYYNENTQIIKVKSHKLLA